MRARGAHTRSAHGREQLLPRVHLVHLVPEKSLLRLPPAPPVPRAPENLESGWLGRYGIGSMPKQPEGPLGVHLVVAAEQVSRLMAQAVLSPKPEFQARKFLADAGRLAQGIFDLPEHSPASRQRALDEIAGRWCTLAAAGLEQMRTQRQTRRRPSVLAL